MNYYLDFDNTLYETSKLTKRMLEKIANFVLENCENVGKEIFDEVTQNFNSTTGNIFLYAESIATKYNLNKDEMKSHIKNIIDSGEDITFEDAKRFLKKLKSKGHKIILLTYVPDEKNKDYQNEKITGSGLKEYFDKIIITSEYKFTIDLDYKNGIFIDDDPRDLLGLYEKNPIKVIRIRKKSNKRSKIDIENKDILEYESFDDIEI